MQTCFRRYGGGPRLCLSEAAPVEISESRGTGMLIFDKRIFATFDKLSGSTLVSTCGSIRVSAKAVSILPEFEGMIRPIDGCLEIAQDCVDPMKA